MFTNKEAIEAIKARISGEWDNEQLLKIGALHESAIDDIINIIDNIAE